jgi:adenylate cyclase
LVSGDGATSRVRLKPTLDFARKQFLPAVVCFGAALALSSLTTMVERVDNIGVDALTRKRAQLKPRPCPEDVVLIGIDEGGLRNPTYGRWPWKPETHAEFLKELRMVKPGVVAWDILFTEYDEPEADTLAQGIIKSGLPVVLGAMRGEHDEGIVPDDEAAKTSRLALLSRVVGDRGAIASSPTMILPPGELGRLAGMGFVDTPPASDGVRRAAPLVVRIGEAVYPTLALRTLMEYWHARPENVEVRLGEAVLIDAPLAKRRIPIDRHGRYWINYRQALPPDVEPGFTTYGYSVIDQLLYDRYFKQDRTVEVPPLTGKILLVGQVADGLTDMGPTPFGGLTPLVLVHGNVIANVLEEDYMKRVPDVWIWTGGFLLAILGRLRFANRKLRDLAIFSASVPVAYGATAAFLWMGNSWLMPVAGPVLGFVALQVFILGRRAFAEARAKQQIKGMFGAYLAPELVDRMAKAGDMPQLGGHEAEITAYFSDIQGYSTFSEKLPPARLVELLNEYLTACTDIVLEERGSLDKYIGDAVVAMFGAPVPLPDHAYRACVAALRVQARLDELRRKWDSQGDVWPAGVRQMRSRIGLNTGPAIIGNMGSRSRFNYTMTGDNVNLAARMESGAKLLGTYIMITDATKTACEARGGDHVIFRPLGRIVVKGRTSTVPIHEVAGLKENVSARQRDCIDLFGQGLERYYARDWDQAVAWFIRSRDLEVDVPGKSPGVTRNPSLAYLDIVEEYRREPPGESWEGEYVMKEK